MKMLEPLPVIVFTPSATVERTQLAIAVSVKHFLPPLHGGPQLHGIYYISSTP